jgi:hypothetical protein
MTSQQKGDAMKERERDYSSIVTACSVAVGVSAILLGGEAPGALIGAAVGWVGGAILVRAIKRRQSVT